jgi:hypothetical protein
MSNLINYLSNLAYFKKVKNNVYLAIHTKMKIFEFTILLCF